MLRWLIGIILGEIICGSSNCQHMQRLKIAILGANWQLLRLERIAKCSYSSLSTQNIKFYWFVMKIKKFLLPIWWYNRGLFLLGINIWGLHSEWVNPLLSLPCKALQAIEKKVNWIVMNLFPNSQASESSYKYPSTSCSVVPLETLRLCLVQCCICRRILPQYLCVRSMMISMHIMLI